MGFLDILEAKYLRWLGFVSARSDPIDDGLEGYIRQRTFGRTKGPTDEAAEMHPNVGHLKHRIEVRDGVNMIEQSHHTDPSAPARHSK